ATDTAWRRTVWAYYDFNGVYFHDGVQATIGDVMFNYVMQSLNPRFNTDMRILWDDPNAAAFPASRHINIFVAWCGPTDTQWEGASTLPGVNNLRCALRFQLQDDFALFYRVNPSNPSIVYDSALPTYMHQPFIDAILFKIYRTTQLGVLALQSGEIDFYHWNVPPEFVPDLLNDPNIRVWANAEPGFFYLAYNMRRQPFGYTTFPPTPATDRSSDAGLPFRKAFAHLIDKATIVRTLLQNYGVIADGTVSPANTFWYNGTLPKYAYDPAQAALILDTAGRTDTEGDGWREFPRLGDNQFAILTPQADYYPIRASAGAMIAAAARSIGVNVVSKPTAFGAIVAATNAHDFDMFILGWRISGTDPDYLFSFFHSSNAAAGQNYQGFYDSTFDSVVSASRKELNEQKLQELIKYAQGILADRLPYDVLYYRTVIEAERQDRFVNYSVASGTIWNFWSLQSI